MDVRNAAVRRRITRLPLAKLCLGRARRIIYQLSEHVTFSYPTFFHLSASGIARQENQLVTFSGSGAGFSVKESLEKTLGEAIERHSLATVDAKRIRFCRRIDLADSAFDPRHFISFYNNADGSPSSLDQYSDREPLSWVEATEVITKSRGYVPAQFAHFPFIAPTAEPNLWIANSSGAAAARTRVAALERAILEVIERDTMMLTWYGARPVLKINKWRLPEAQRVIDQEKISAIPFALENEFGLPTIMVVTISHSKRKPYLSTGCATSWTWRGALRSAMIEALQNRNWMSGGAGYLQTRNVQDVVDNQHHAFLYAHEKNAKAFDFMMTGDNIEFGSLVAQSQWEGRNSRLSYLLQQLDRLNYKVWAIELSSDFARSVGYCVMRAIIPGLIPVQFGYKMLPLRLFRLRQAMMGRRIGKVIWPHPMP